MKITLLVVGKTDASWLAEGISIFTRRLAHYTKFAIIEIQLPKSAKQYNPLQLKDAEGKVLLRHFSESDHVCLLDEQGKLLPSTQFADWLQKMMNGGTRHLMFVVGGAFGFSDEVYAAAHSRISLSPMTFSHQMVRLFFAEQLYRAFTILKNEPYHNS